MTSFDTFYFVKNALISFGNLDKRMLEELTNCLTYVNRSEFVRLSELLVFWDDFS